MAATGFDVIYYGLPATVRTVIALKNNSRPESAVSGKSHFANPDVYTAKNGRVIELRDDDDDDDDSNRSSTPLLCPSQSNIVTLLPSLLLRPNAVAASVGIPLTKPPYLMDNGVVRLWLISFLALQKLEKKNHVPLIPPTWPKIVSDYGNSTTICRTLLILI